MQSKVGLSLQCVIEVGKDSWSFCSSRRAVSCCSHNEGAFFPPRFLLFHRISELASLSFFFFQIPTAEEKVLLEQITIKLADFESVSKALQGGGDKRTSRAQARKLFDDLIDAHSTDDRELIHLSEDAAIVNNRHFENGVVKLQSGKESSLTYTEKAAIKMFLKPVPVVQGGGRVAPIPAPHIPAPAAPSPLSFAERSRLAFEEEKDSREAVSKYESTEHCGADNNICERLFSTAKLIFSALRKRMDPDTLDMLLFLKANRYLWKDKCIIDDIIAESGEVGDVHEPFI